MNDTALTTAAPHAAPSAWRAWCYLVWLSWQRQARARQMVWIALVLLLFATVFVAFLTMMGRWDLHNRRWPSSGQSAEQARLDLRNRHSPQGKPTRDTADVGDAADAAQLWFWMYPSGQGGVPRANPFIAAWQLALNQFSLQVAMFVNSVVFVWFLMFLLPLWSMSFATEAMGGDRESNSLIWLLTRPLPRPAIYLAKFVAMLPWSLALNVGGFGLLCLVGGKPGREVFKLLWPSVLCGALAFSTLFFFFGAFFRWPAVVAIVYTFFLETLLNLMPAYLKRISISFYTRCMMYDALQDYNIQPPAPQVFMPVDGPTAAAILLGATLLFLVLGMLCFARKEYHEIS